MNVVEQFAADVLNAWNQSSARYMKVNGYRAAELNSQSRAGEPALPGKTLSKIYLLRLPINSTED